MATHGVPRSQPPPTASAAAKEAQKISAYQAQSSSLNSLISSHTFTTETLSLTTSLLTQNPEHYTIWNHRRRILLHLLSPASVDEEAKLLQHDLDWIIPLLMKYPKCYWIWNHRIWTLEQLEKRTPAAAEPAWQNELKLVSKMLQRDARNFHGWDYRRIVIRHLHTLSASPTEASAEANPLTRSEFEYSTSLLRTNLSNFSAWHARSKLLPRLHRTPSPESKALFHSELDFLRSALLLDPYDQSLWKYHEYLVFVLTASAAAKHTPDSVEARDASWVDFSAEEVRQVLKDDVEELRALLDDCADCKWLYLGLLEMAEKMRTAGDTVDEAETRDWLRKLAQLDPIRRGRWVDLGRRLGLDGALDDQ